MRRAFFAVPAVALLLSGCGAAQSSSSNDLPEGAPQDIAKLVDNLASYGSRGNGQAICDDILASQLKTELKNAGGNCVDEMNRAIKDASDFDLQVTKVDVNGNNATATVRQGEDAKNTATFTFVKEKGGWRASALGGS
jgi:hypothetical protein